MNFDQRKSEAQRLVANFLDDFAPPRQMDNDKLLSRINFIADAFARKMPTKGDYAAAVGEVLMKIRDTHMSNSWPSQAAFVMAMPQGERPQFAQLQDYRPDEKQMYASRIEDRQPVPESVIWGGISNQLSVDRGRLEEYRALSVKNWQETYKGDAQRLMRQKHGAQVDLFFPARSVAAE